MQRDVHHPIGSKENKHDPGAQCEKARNGVYDGNRVGTFSGSSSILLEKVVDRTKKRSHSNQSDEEDEESDGFRILL